MKDCRRSKEHVVQMPSPEERPLEVRLHLAPPARTLLKIGEHSPQLPWHWARMKVSSETIVNRKEVTEQFQQQYLSLVGAGQMPWIDSGLLCTLLLVVGPNILDGSLKLIILEALVLLAYQSFTKI